VKLRFVAHAWCVAFLSWSSIVAAQESASAGGQPEGVSEGRESITWSWLGRPRTISRGWSASRDTPAMEMGIFPRPIARVGGDFALFALDHPRYTLRTGFAGMIELEGDGETDGVNSGPLPSTTGTILWRGSYEYFVAFTPDDFGRRLCSRCEIETTLGYRHESQHYTGSNYGGDGIDVSTQPYVGDDVGVDVAVSQRVGKFYLVQRLIAKEFLPERSSYAMGVAGDLHARYLFVRWPQPFTSLYWEFLRGSAIRDREFPNAYRVRNLTGVALPSTLGEILVYLSADVGHRYGVFGLTEEATLGFGIRLSILSGPNPTTKPDLDRAILRGSMQSGAGGSMKQSGGGMSPQWSAGASKRSGAVGGRGRVSRGPRGRPGKR